MNKRRLGTALFAVVLLAGLTSCSVGEPLSQQRGWSPGGYNNDRTQRQRPLTLQRVYKSKYSEVWSIQ